VIGAAASAVAARIEWKCRQELSGVSDTERILEIVRRNSEQAIFSMLADLSESGEDAFLAQLRAYLNRRRADGHSLQERTARP
jgi:hypothetical protein